MSKILGLIEDLPTTVQTRPLTDEPSAVPTIKCLEVIVRFTTKANTPNILINRNHGDSRAIYLRVEDYGTTLRICFCDKNDEVIQTINYKGDTVHEYATQGWVA